MLDRNGKDRREPPILDRNHTDSDRWRKRGISQLIHESIHPFGSLAIPEGPKALRLILTDDLPLSGITCPAQCEQAI